MKILLIEDDEQLCHAIVYALTQHGHSINACHEGDDGLRWMREGIYDLVLLDRMLPRLDGITLLQTARKEGIITPVLMITALGSLSQVVEGLDSGADDYIVKPFAMEELLARVRAMERRPRVWDITKDILGGDLTLKPLNKELVRGQGQEREKTSLSKRESDLMEIFLKHIGQTLPRATLLSQVWGPDAPIEEGNLENYVHFLRRRLAAVGSQMQIRTVRGVGYLLEDSHV